MLCAVPVHNEGADKDFGDPLRMQSESGLMDKASCLARMLAAPKLFRQKLFLFSNTLVYALYPIMNALSVDRPGRRPRLPINRKPSRKWHTQTHRHIHTYTPSIPKHMLGT